MEKDTKILVFVQLKLLTVNQVSLEIGDFSIKSEEGATVDDRSPVKDQRLLV